MPVGVSGGQIVEIANSSSGAVSTSNPLPVTLATTSAGEDQTNNRLNVVGVDSAGNVNKWAINAALQLNVNTEGLRASYSASVNAHAPAATPTDWFTILGSATKIVRITRIRIQTRATAGNQYRIAIRKYSTAFTGGTPAVVTSAPHDSANAAATAVVNTWAGGLPTIGTPIASITDESLPQAVLATPAAGLFPYTYEFGNRNGQTIVLRGVTQYVGLWSNAVALPGGFVADVHVEWTESAD